MTNLPNHPDSLQKPPHRWLRGLFLLLVGLAVGAGAMHFFQRRTHNHGPTGGAEAVRYHCPMHPTYTADAPGACPICGMKLTPIEQAGNAAEPAKRLPTARKLRFYRSPMDPNQTSPVPAKDQMGMDFIPVYDEQTSTAMADAATPVAGMVEVQFSAERLQLLGVRTALAEVAAVADSVQTTVRLAADETRVHQVTVKVEAYVEKVHVGVVGDVVRKGQPLLTVYSPELFAAEAEYASAVRSGSTFGQLDVSGATAEKLRLWDVPQATIAALARGGKPQRTLTFTAPMSGTLTERKVSEGARLMPGDMALQLTDLTSLWAVADLRTDDIAKLHAGMRATVRLLAYPGRTFMGTVDVVEPGIDPQTRALRVRIALKNGDGTLHPEMYGEVELHGETHEAVTVPSDAVIDSGSVQVVLVALPTPGAFMPRQVHVGVRVGQRVEVLDGLAAGERVVTRANFLIDSESRLKAALASLAPESP